MQVCLLQFGSSVVQLKIDPGKRNKENKVHKVKLHFLRTPFLGLVVLNGNALPANNIRVET
jgi:hypothetical protein